jgi:hypothetical protein
MEWPEAGREHARRAGMKKPAEVSLAGLIR